MSADAAYRVPFLLAPIGYTRLLHADTEVGVAKAAKNTGVGYVLTTFAGTRVEDVAAAAGPLWYQRYLAGGRAVVETALARAWASGCRVLALTIDTYAPCMRERDVRNGSARLLGHPGWLYGFLRDYDVMHYPKIVMPGTGPARAHDGRSMLADSIADWSDLAWIRQAWPGATVMKGVMGVDATNRRHVGTTP